jgi:ubiquinone/menaquinone biosynthesis C-methylase UbiE
MRGGWNHNVQYHDLLLGTVPAGCQSALDVGCGDGTFLRKLATRAERAVGIDASAEMIRRAETVCAGIPDLQLLHGDFLDVPLEEGGFDFVSALAVVHHMDFDTAIEKARRVLRPGGVLAILGVARDRSAKDVGVSAVAVPVNRFLRLQRGWYETGAPVLDPTMSYREVQAAGRSLLPGARYRRLLLFRYLLSWRKDPGATRACVP